MEKIAEKIKKSGFLELLFLVTAISFEIFISKIKVFLLRIRGYDIDYSVKVGRHAFFFQDTKHAVMVNKNTSIGFGVRIKTGFNGKIKIGSDVLIDDYSFVSSHRLISIGSGTMISANCYIVDFNHKYPLSKNDISKSEGYLSKPVKIGSHVWIGTHVIILPGVEIGDGAVIGAGSIVVEDVAPFTIAVGNPARVIKYIKNDKPN